MIPHSNVRQKQNKAAQDELSLEALPPTPLHCVVDALSDNYNVDKQMCNLSTAFI